MTFTRGGVKKGSFFFFVCTSPPHSFRSPPLQKKKVNVFFRLIQTKVVFNPCAKKKGFRSPEVCPFGKNVRGRIGIRGAKRTAMEIRRALEPKLCAGFGVVCAVLCNVAGRGWATFNAKIRFKPKVGIGPRPKVSGFRFYGSGVQGFRLKVQSSGCRF